MMFDDPAIERLDAWLRGRFQALNTQLEDAYWAAGTELLRDPTLDPIKRALMTEGAALAGAIDTLPGRPRERYELLGMVGYVLGACRRHELEDSLVLAPAWTVAQRLGDALGVAPRYTFAHQALFNTARDGRFRTFTTERAEARFIELNAIGVVGYADAAAALRRIPALGVSNPVAGHALDLARLALERVLAADQELARDVPVDRFFRTIRPYFKSHAVGAVTWRGVNAGDFSAINEIDVLLGLADPADPFYAGIVAEKLPYVPPDDVPILRSLGQDGSLLARFEAELAADPGSEALRATITRFLAVCRAHAAAASFHHHALVRPFLERPAAALPPDRTADVSASGPPLEEVVATLGRLAALRTAKAPMARLREAVAGAAGEP
jgi:hypothetical protein